MGVDWFTVVVQIANFLILVWFLKKFLYKPILGAMERREKTIAGRLQEAAKQKREAMAEKERYLEMQRGFKQAAQKEIEMARKEADDLRVQLVKEARQEGESARSQWLQTVEQEKKAFLEQTTRAIVLHFEQLASAVLQNLADEGLEKKILATFLCKIDLLPPEDLQGLREAAAAGEPVVITSAFSGSEAVRAEINRYCAQVLSPDALVQFREDTKLVAGIHLTVGNKKICWDIQQYLKEFHDSLSKSLDLEMLR